MKKYVTYAAAVFFATSTVAFALPDKDMMMEKEKAAWQAFKDKKGDDFKKIASANMLGVYADGVSDLTKELSDMQKWDMKSFEISDYKITAQGSDTVVATYKVTITGTVDGTDASGSYNCGSVWKNEKGQWRAIFHTNVKEEAATKPAG